jgi:hypothetical protein
VEAPAMGAVPGALGGTEPAVGPLGPAVDRPLP